MTHAVIYDRASTKNQEDNFSRVNAREVGIRIAEQNGFTWEYVKEIGSGTTLTGRPEMMKILDRIAGGEIQVIIVQELDRLARPEDGVIYFTIAKAITDNSVIIHTHTKVVDLNNDDDSLLTDIEMAIAKRERRSILKRSKRARVSRAEQGKFSGNPGLGYEVDEQDPANDLIIEPDEAETVKVIFNTLEATGGNLQQTAKYLNKNGYVGKRGGAFGHWSVLQVASRKLYVGIHESKLTDKVTHRPDLQIISGSQFERVHQLIKTRKGNERDLGRRGKYIFTGFVGCSNCGGVMVAGKDSKGVKYQCRNSRYANSTCVGGKTYAEHLILPPITDFLADFIQNQIDFHTSLDNAAAQYGKSITEEAVEVAIQGELTSVQAGKQRVIESISLGIVTNEEAAAKLAELREQEQRLTVELSSIAEKTAIMAEWQEAVEALKGRDISGSLYRLAESNPISFRRLLSLVFKPNSLQVRTERATGRKWRGVLEDYQLTKAMQANLQGDILSIGIKL